MSRLLNDTDEDIQLPQRGADRRTSNAESMRHDAREMKEESDREFTLSTGTVLALFFALALVCAVFFGFGYTMGRKSGQATAETASAGQTSDTATDTSVAAKPAAGAPAVQAIPGYLSQGQADSANRSATSQSYKATTTTNAAGTTVTIPTGGAKPVTPSQRVAPVPATKFDSDAHVVGDPLPVTRQAPIVRSAPTPVPIVIPPSTTESAVAGSGSSYVQIAAVSHKEDADVLLSALKRRGYSVFTRAGDGDKLIHVQVGPFASKKDAEAMRQRLLGDGYNAILK